MYLQKYFAAGLLAIALFTGCKKDETNTQNLSEKGPYSTLPATLMAHTEPLQLMDVNADEGGTFVLKRGTRLVIPKKAFVTAYGDSVDGTVQVSVQEFVDRAEMIYANVLPANASDDAPLITGGGLLFLAEQKGNSVHFRSPVQAYLPQRNLLQAVFYPLTGYYGYQNEVPINKIFWNPNSRFNYALPTAADTVLFSFDTTGYHMPAAPYTIFNPGNNQDTVRFALSGPAPLTASNSVLYILPKNVRTVIKAGDGLSMRNQDRYVVDGTEVNLVGMALVNGYFYGGISTVKFENRKNYSITISETKPEDFKKQIQDLL